MDNVADKYNATVVAKQSLTPDLFIIKVRPDKPTAPFVSGQYVLLGLSSNIPRREGSEPEFKESKPDRMILRAYSLADGRPLGLQNLGKVSGGAGLAVWQGMYVVVADGVVRGIRHQGSTFTRTWTADDRDFQAVDPAVSKGVVYLLRNGRVASLDAVRGDSFDLAGVRTDEGTASRGKASIEFSPDGTAAYTEILLDDDSGRRVEIEVLPLAESVRVFDAES